MATFGASCSSGSPQKAAQPANPPKRTVATPHPAHLPSWMIATRGLHAYVRWATWGGGHQAYLVGSIQSLDNYVRSSDLNARPGNVVDQNVGVEVVVGSEYPDTSGVQATVSVPRVKVYAPDRSWSAYTPLGELIPKIGPGTVIVAYGGPSKSVVVGSHDPDLDTGDMGKIVAKIPTGTKLRILAQDPVNDGFQVETVEASPVVGWIDDNGAGYPGYLPSEYAQYDDACKCIGLKVYSGTDAASFGLSK